jgi:hypothetical protein
MPLPETSRFELTSNLTICRILNGMWQVSVSNSNSGGSWGLK